MTARNFSGRCAMHVDGLDLGAPLGVSRGRPLVLVLRLLLCLAGGSVQAAEAPMADPLAPGAPPPSAEAAQQDLNRARSAETWLDEAIFTEISPLRIPEIGIALPADQTE